MAKKKKKSQNHPPNQAPQTPQAPPQPNIQKPQAHVDKNRLDSDLSKAARCFVQGDKDYGMRLLDRHWPFEESPSPIMLRRVLWLFQHAPEQAQQELKQLSTLLSPEQLDILLHSLTLLLPDEQYTPLLDLHIGTPAQREESQIVRVALKATLAGQEQEALDQLRKLPLRSAFRDASLLLRGLTDWFHQREESALSSFQRLQKHPIYGGFVRLFLPEAEQLPFSRSLRAQAEDAFSIATAPAQELLQILKASAKEKKTFHLLRNIERLFPKLPKPLQEALYYDLPSFLIWMGISAETAFDRCKKLFSAPSFDPDFLRLGGVLSEHDDILSQAVDFWEAYLKTLKQKDGYPAWTQLPEFQACIHAHIASHLMKEASELRREEKEPFAFWEEDDDDAEESWSEVVEKAQKHLEQALQQMPKEPELWKQLYGTFLFLDQPKKADQILEKMVKALPQDPQVMIVAARAAAKREAYDKALLYIRKVRELEPLNRHLIHDETDFLLKKAIKKYRQDGLEKAFKIIEEVQLSQLPVQLYSYVVAVKAAILGNDGQSQAAQQTLQEAHTHHTAMPWLLFAFFLQTSEEIRAKHQKKNSPQKLADSLLKDAPQTAEMEVLLTRFEPPKKNLSRSSSLENHLQKAIEVGYPVLTKRESLSKAIEWTHDETIRQKIAEHAHSLFPKDEHFVKIRYELALEAKLDPSYFAHVEQEFSVFSIPPEKIEAAEALLAETGGFFPWFLLDRMDPLNEMAFLWAKIRRYLSQNKRKTTRPSTKKRRTPR